MNQVVNVMPAARSGRMMRRPAHSWHLRHKPFQIQPFMIAPVLPGETLKTGLMQARAITDPIKNRLIGWHLEHYVFYVKHRDLEVDWVEDMVLNPDFDYTTVDDPSADTKLYFKGGAINWVKLCLDKVVDEFFRNEDEIGTSFTIGGLPAAAVNGNRWTDSIYRTVNAPADVDVDGPDVNTTIQASEIDKAMRLWEFARANGLTEMSYEDYLMTYGIKPTREELHVPELIRYSRSWQYPSNAVDGDGSVSSAVSWSISERIDKDRFFREPGFIFGVTVARPKVYFSNQSGAAVHMLRDAFSWLPRVLSNDPYSSLREFSSTGGPLAGQSDGYWVDVKDLWLYGDQFVNFAVSDTNFGKVALPTADLQRRYPSETDVDGLFSADTAETVQQDGVIQLTVAASLRDTTPTGGLG